ncbi:hypothetical protein ACA511_32255 [Actinomadura sp. GTD37]
MKKAVTAAAGAGWTCANTHVTAAGSGLEAECMSGVKVIQGDGMSPAGDDAEFPAGAAIPRVGNSLNIGAES